MKITNNKIISLLNLFSFFNDLKEDEYDIDNPIFIEKLKKVTIFKCSYKSFDDFLKLNEKDEINAYMQLCALVSNCPNLKNFNLKVSDKEYKSVEDLLYKVKFDIPKLEEKNMKITNYKIQQTLVKYVDLSDLDEEEYKLNNPKFLEKLKKITIFRCSYKTFDDFFKLTNGDEENVYEQLCALLSRCPNLQTLYLKVSDKEYKSVNDLLYKAKFDNPQLKEKNTKITNYFIIHKLKRIDSLAYFDEYDLNDPKFSEELKNVTSLNIDFKSLQKKLGENDVSTPYEQLCALIQHCPNLTEFHLHFANGKNNQEYKSFDDLLILLMDLDKIRTIDLADVDADVDYDKTISLIESNPHKNVRICLNTKYDEKREFEYLLSSEKIINSLEFNITNPIYNEISGYLKSKVIPIDVYKKYKEFFIGKKDFIISIKNVSELDINRLEEFRREGIFKGIKIKCEKFVEATGYDIYTLDEYYEIRKCIDEIISNIHFPKEDEQDKEKKVFYQLYKILGMNIFYDYYENTKEGRKDKKLTVDSRNLKNGLLGVVRNGKKERLTVCEGYANILQNICACLGIKCLKLDSSKHGSPIGHAYDLVVLDGQPYLCDLTWDRDEMILSNGIAQNFLCSYEDFLKNHSWVGFCGETFKIISQAGEYVVDFDIKSCTKTLSIDEQIELSGYNVKTSVEELVSTSYLSGFVVEYLEFIKQCKSKVEINDYLKIIDDVKTIEKMIINSDLNKSENLNNSALAYRVKVYDGIRHISSEKYIPYYDGEKTTVGEIQEEVEQNTGGWKRR